MNTLNTVDFTGYSKIGIVFDAKSNSKYISSEGAYKQLTFGIAIGLNESALGSTTFLICGSTGSGYDYTDEYREYSLDGVPNNAYINIRQFWNYGSSGDMQGSSAIKQVMLIK